VGWKVVDYQFGQLFINVNISICITPIEVIQKWRESSSSEL